MKFSTSLALFALLVGIVGCASEDEKKESDDTVIVEPQGEFYIEEISGSLQPGSLVTITGEGFGDAGPEYLFVSDFDQETVSESDPLTLRNSQAGEVSSPSGEISSQQARSGNQSMLVSEGNAESYIEGSNVFSAKDFNEFFVSFHKYDDASRANDSDIERLAGTRKDVWVMRGERGDNPSSGGSGSGNDLYLRHNGISGNSTDQHWYPELHDTKDSWVNWQYWVRTDPSRPYSDSKAMASSFVAGSVGQKANAHLGGLFSDQTANDTPPFWDRIKIGGYLRNLPVYHDDYYVAVGDQGETSNAAARVEFFNASKYEESTARSFCLIESWEDETISCRPTTGDMNWSSGPIYCVVFDGNNKRSKEFDCKENRVTNRRLAYLSFSDSDDIQALYSNFSVNSINPDNGNLLTESLVDIQGEELPISVSIEQINVSAGWEGSPSITHVSLPDLFMRNNLKVNGDGVTARVSGFEAGKEITLRADGAYFRDGDYITEVQLNQESTTYNSEAKGIHEPALITGLADENGEITINIFPANGEGSYLSWISLEYLDN